MCVAVVILILGQAVGHIEKWNPFDAFYWAFITATTVGYGDIRPLNKFSRVLAIFIAIIGIMFTRIIVSVTLYTAQVTIDSKADPDDIEKIKKQLENVEGLEG